MKKGVDSESHSGDPITLNKDNDLYEYYMTAKRVAKTIEESATPFVVGIYGRWGRGKSTFLNTIKNEL
jgi:pantothenate kinase-related protein Tda10